jgi:hypothetical protein
MLIAIQFNDQLCGGTKKVRDIGTYRLLSAES